MTPAEEIAAAARTLRALLADPQLTPGPWLSMDRGDRVLWDGDGAHDQPPVYVVDEPMSNGANADYIAVMHPDVAHLLADWLDTAAVNAAVLTWPNDFIKRALAVARAINGGEQR